MKRHPLTFVIGALLVLLFGVLLFFFQVRKSEVAVVTTFGKPTKDYPNPGAYFKWPWPIQEVHRFDQRIQNFEDQFEQANTADSFSLLTMVYVGWRISDPKAFFPKFSSGSVAEVERTLENLVRSAKSAVVGKHPLAHFVSTNETELKFVEIEKEILDLVRSQVHTNNYGIDLEFLGIKKLGFPESVTTAVFDRMQSERQVLVTTTQYGGEADAARIRSAADRKSAEMLTEAEAKAIDIKGQGEHEAGKSFETFKQNPELANFLLRLNALEISLKDRATLIFDQNTPPFDLFMGISTNLLKK